MHPYDRTLAECTFVHSDENMRPVSTFTSSRPRVAPEHQSARVAVAALFLTNGALFANVLPRFPQIKGDLGLNNAEYGLAVAAYPAGALVAGLAAGALIRRFRSSRMAVAGTVLTGLGLWLAGVAPHGVVFAAMLFLTGAADAITDVAQNSHGLRVQRLYRRSILNSFHAIWSIGAVLGGVMGGAAAGMDIPRSLHLGVSALLFATVSLAAYRFLLPGPEPEAFEPSAQHSESISSARGAVILRWAILLALVLIAASGALVEDAGSTWASVYLSGELGAPISIAACGYVALVGAQFIGRLLGDRLVDRFGQRAIARGGGVLVATGMAAALSWPSVPGTIAGFASAGLGVATLVPAAMHSADELPGFRPGTGLTVVSWLMRLGFLLSPPLVGLVADQTSLRTGLLVVVLAGLIVTLAAQVLTHDTERRRAQTREQHELPDDQ